MKSSVTNLTCLWLGKTKAVNFIPSFILKKINIKTAPHCLYHLASEAKLSPDAPFPFAAFSALEVLNNPEKQAYYLCVNPISIQTTHNAAYIQDNTHIALTASQANALANDIADLIKGRGWHLQVPHPLHWYISSATPIDINNPPLSHVVEKNIQPFLANEQKSISTWALFTEIQMLLHQHPINTQRAEQGLPEINALWLWGAGCLPSGWQCPWHSVSGNNALAKGIVHEANCDAFDVNEDYPFTLKSGEHLLILDQEDESTSSKILKNIMLAHSQAKLNQVVLMEESTCYQINRQDWPWWYRWKALGRWSLHRTEI